MPRFLIAFFIFAANATIAVGGRDLTPPTYGTTPYAYGLHSNPIVATNGETFLTLWSATTINGGVGNVYSSVADANGKLLRQTSALTLPKTLVLNLYPADAGYVALVRDDVPSTRLLNTPPKVIFLDSSGRLLQRGAELPEPFLSTRAFNGSRFFALTYTTALVGEIASLDGTVIGYTAPLSQQSGAAVAACGRDFAVVTSEKDGLYIHTFGDDGSERTPKTRFATPANPEVSFSVAAADDQLGVAWVEQPNTTSAPNTVHVAAIRRDGTLLGESRFAAPGATSSKVIWSGAKYVVCGRNFAATFDRAGAILEGPVAIANGPATATTAAVAYSVALSYPTSYQPIITGEAISLDPLRSNGTEILSINLRRQVWPAIASDGIGSLAIWSEQTADEKSLMAVRLDSTGAPVGDPINLGAANPPREILELYYPRSRTYSLAFGSSVYLVVWQQGRDVVARRLDRFGNVLDSQPLTLATNAGISDQCVAWNGNAFLIATNAGGVIVHETGAPAPAERFPPTWTAPTITWDGTLFLMTWPDPPGPCPFECVYAPSSLFMMRLAAAGTPLDAKPTTIPWTTLSTFHVATSGKEFVITADIGYTIRTIDAVVVHAIGAALQVSSPVTLFRWVDPIISDIRWNGETYDVVWRYANADRQWLGWMQTDGTLTKRVALFTPLVAADSYDQPAIAAGVVLTSGAAALGEIGRVRSYTRDDFGMQPAPPPAPLITTAVGTFRTATIQWLSAPVPIEGFVIERINPFMANATGFRLAVVPADGRTATVDMQAPFYPEDLYVRMLTFNTGGVSEPTAPVHVLPPPRLRTVRH